jgi:hypothetical protein
VFGVLDYGGSRGATAEEARALRDQVLSKADLLVAVGHDGFPRGELLAKESGQAGRGGGWVLMNRDLA